MRKVKDLVGQRFGRLIVKEHIGSNKNHVSLWKCLCDCGNEVTRNRNSLIYGTTFSCGCWAKEKTHNRNTGTMKAGLEAKQHPTIKDIYWTAGIYEGEGCCQYNSHTARSSVAQKDPWILEKLKLLFGGSISLGLTGMSNWQLSGSRARGFLMTIYCLLSPRRQAQIRKVLFKNGR